MTTNRPSISEIPGLAEKLAQVRRRERRVQLRLLAAIVAGALLVGGAALYAVSQLEGESPPRVVIDPAKLPPIEPGPPR
jgi:hypothetical protein